MSEEEKKKIKQAQQIEALRQIRMQYGAASPEYQTALAAFQGPCAKEVKDKERERQNKLLAEKQKREEEEMRRLEEAKRKAKEVEIKEKERENQNKLLAAKKKREEEEMHRLEEAKKKAKERERKRKQREEMKREQAKKLAEELALKQQLEQDRAINDEKEKALGEKRVQARDYALVSQLQEACDRTDDIDQYAHVIAALKEVEKAKEDGHPLSPELSVKVVEMKQFAKRLEHAYKLRQLVLNLNSRTLAEIKSFKNPHPSIMKAMQATFLLLGSNVEDVDTWSEVRTKMGKTGRESLKRLISQFTPSQVSKKHLEAAKKKIREIDPENIERISQGAYVLFGWATSVLMQLDKSFELHKENKFDIIKRALKVEQALIKSSDHQD